MLVIEPRFFGLHCLTSCYNKWGVFFIRLEVLFPCRMFPFKIFHRQRFIGLVVLHYTIYCIKDYICYVCTCMFGTTCIGFAAKSELFTSTSKLLSCSDFRRMHQGRTVCIYAHSLSLNDHSLLSILFLPPEQPVVVLACTSYFNTHSLFHTVSAKNKHRSSPTLLQ
jgi:hypothetical protein